MKTATSSEIDVHRLAAAIQAKRGAAGMRAASKEIGISAPTLSRIEQRRLPDLESFLRICRWLKMPPESFATVKKTLDKPDHLQEIEIHLRSDRTLPKETAEALSRMVRLAYDAVRRGNL